VPTGNQTTLQLVIDGLKMTPVDPAFTDGRDAILDADCATNACAHEDFIWQTSPSAGSAGERRSRAGEARLIPPGAAVAPAERPSSPLVWPPYPANQPPYPR